eukprot:TRINITY_DN12990_c0_g1_i1.p1 TRINITY_DN12990_c0_g1~~TRINITY_DN12990_c0_g1_i1.p1  ORF type:complete len:295 (-),score=45.61 TRINITY_DN12990_c0_g1_i1:209-1093(-)
MGELSDEDVATIRLTQYMTCSLALVASLCVIVSHWRDRSAPVFTLKLAYYLCLADFFTEVSALLSMPFLDSLSADIEELDPVLCQIQAAGTYYFKIVACFWTTSIAYTIYRLIVHMDTACYRFERYFHIINWGVPMIFTSIMFSLEAFGPTVPFCFVDEEHESLRFPMFYGLIFSIIAVDVYLYIQVIRGLQRHVEESGEEFPLKHRTFDEAETKVTKRILHIVTIFLATWAMPVANRVYLLFDSNPNFWLYWLHFFLGPLEGFWNGLLYGDNKRMRRKMGLSQTVMTYSPVDD